MDKGEPVLPGIDGGWAGPVRVTSVEGVATVGTLLVAPLLVGEEHCILEVRAKRGVSSQTHAHPHESSVYVLSGRLRTVVGRDVGELRQGEACRHPRGAMHSVEALEDTVYLEIKTPVPDLRSVFGG